MRRLAIVGLLAASAVGAQAESFIDHARVRGLEPAYQNRDDAAALAQRVTSGRILSVDSAQAWGGPAWRVKVVTAQGEVRVIFIDAAGGKPL